jgi:UDP-N-acetylmuramate--alanine ligase
MIAERGMVIHFIGIGGTGLSAIARVLLESGFTVTGSDRQLSPLAQGLMDAGVRVWIGHQAVNVADASMVVRSSAVPDNNVEVQAALAAGIPVYKRSEFLGQLLVDRIGVAVAGTHGKTTTTAMIAWMLSEIGQEPSFIIGGVSKNLNTNARAGKGKIFVIEADEYDRMFLGLRPKIAIVTNIEHDHPDCYPTAEDFYQAFMAFAMNLNHQGLLIGCGDDEGVKRLVTEIRAQGVLAMTYGFQHNCFYQAQNLSCGANGCYAFSMFFQDNFLGSLTLQVPGKHNLLNALAALAAIHQLGLPLAPAFRAMANFIGTGRRFELRGEIHGTVVIDDYAHHPTEIKATLSAARDRYPGRRIWAVWQPHTFTRIQALFRQFASAFTLADQVIVTEVYAAREVVNDFSAREVADAITHPKVHFIPTIDQVVKFLHENLASGDVLLVLSAGDADRISTQVLTFLEERELCNG